MGGKTRVAPQLAAVMRANRNGASYYVEPFLGGGSVAALMAPEFTEVHLSDANESLIMLWNEVINGWVPPGYMSRTQWDELKAAEEPSAMKALAGFGASYGAKWFAGYAKHIDGRNPAAEASRSLRLKARRFRHADIRHQDYLDAGKVIGPGALVYCDPPYENTTGYGAVGRFDSAQFWDTAREWSELGARVFVSEYSAPMDWVPVWKLRVQVSMDDNHNTGLEQLFTFGKEVRRG
jgi:DNA adenine methylase